MTRVMSLLMLLLGLFVGSTAAAAYHPPPITGHVTDPANKLSPSDQRTLDSELESYRRQTGNQVAVFLPASLEGESVRDVAIETARAWKVGVKGKDEGVLLLIAPVEREVRIEVGKGAEGLLPDLKANDIIEQDIKPHLAPGHEDWRAATYAGAQAITRAMGGGSATPGGASGGPSPTPSSGSSSVGSYTLLGIVFLVLVFLVPIILFIAILRAIFGVFSSNASVGPGWVSGGTWSNDYDDGWRGGPPPPSWGGGDDNSGGSGFTGGGGDFGGGGSDDSF